MKQIRICQIASVLLLGIASRVSAADPFQVTVQPAAFSSSSAVSALPQVSVEVEVPAHHNLYADQFRVEAPAPIRLIPDSLPTAEKHVDPLTGEEALVFTRSFKALYALEHVSTNRVPITVRWQGCSESVCFLPAAKTFVVSWPGEGSSSSSVSVPTVDVMASVEPADWRALTNRFVPVARGAGYFAPREFISFLKSAQGDESARPEAPLDHWLKRSWWISILILLAGGLALNLTPCVLPMIPVNLAIIGAGAGARSRWSGALLGAWYGLGMTVAYGTLGLLVVLTGSKFGAVNASPWFNLGVAVLFAVLALAMFDVYTIDFSRYQGRFGMAGMGGGALMVIALGALAAILSGACVAPVVLSVLLLSASLYAQGHGAALVLPFILGLGMALPWPLAGAGLAFLPKPGRWMDRIKRGFGILILLAAAYYGYTALTIWRQQPFSGARAGWLNSLPEALARADREQKPVFIDFWASWCKNCHAMDATTFKDAQVRGQLESFVRVKVRAEHPNQPPDREILDAFGVVGLPTYVVLQPKLVK